MEKLKNFYKNAVRSISGIFAAISFYEFFNLAISIVIGEYARVDSGILENVIKFYMQCAIFGYGFGWVYVISKNMGENIEMKVVDKVKTIIISSWIIICIVSILSCILANKIKILIPLLIAYSVTWGIALLVTYILDKNEINKINKKIKE